MLLHTDLHCASRRRASIPTALVNTILQGVNLADVTRPDFMVAAVLPGRLRSADPVHLAAAIRLEADLLITYDAEMATAAIEAGLTVASPGAEL